MYQTSGLQIHKADAVVNLFSWGFGVAVFLAGVINIFWGNDAEFGIFVLALSFAYFPPATAFFTKLTGLAVPGFVKIILAVFIVMAVLGVGELFAKIDMMISAIK